MSKATGRLTSLGILKILSSSRVLFWETAVVQLQSSVRLFVIPWIAAHQVPPSTTIYWSLLKLMSMELVMVMLSSHLILCCPPFFNLSLNHAIRSSCHMCHWATVSSQSCFCWLYRASPLSAARNTINLISVWPIWWCPCVESSLVLLQEGVCYDQWVLLTKGCQPLPCFILYSKEKLVCYSRYLLTAYCCIPVPYDVMDIFGWGGGC